MMDAVRQQDENQDSNLSIEAEISIRAIEASAAFQRAPVLRRLLLYLWEHRGEPVSEYGIGVDVLGRREDFDPKQDATVRVHVSRLRQKLRDFYIEENPPSEVRIVLPSGSPRLHVERVEVPKLVVQPEPSSRTWLIASGITCLVLTVVAIGLGVALWRHTHEPPAVPELPAFWARVLGNGKLTRIVFPTPLFLQSGSLRFRDTTVNDPVGLSRSLTLNLLRRPPGQISVSDRYSVTSDTLALGSLMKLLSNRGIPIEVSATRDLSLELFGSDNLLFLGIPPTSQHVENLLSRTGFYLTLNNTKVGVRHPQAGEPGQFSDVERGSETTTYGIVSVLPGRAPGTKLILVSGLKTFALASFLTSPVTLSDLANFLREKQQPEYFEMVVESQVEGFKLLKARPAAFRTVSASLWK